MANANPSFAGQINNAGDPKAMYLKVWAGEVLTAFTENNVFAERHMTRSISSGKTAQFPATGRTTAEYHTPGTEILGDQIPGNERTISIDDLLIAAVFLSNYDEAMSHFDVRGEYSKQIGIALANAYDQNVARVALLAARSTAVVNGLPGGFSHVVATALTSPNALVQGILDAAQRLDENSIPEDDRYVFLKPAQYWALFNADKITNRDFVGADNNGGGVASGKIMRIGGIPVVKTNHLPQDVVNTGPVAYQGDFSTTAALVMHKAAVGTVKLIDLAVESAYDVRRQGTLLVSKYAVGHGVLRPECAVEIKTA